jgi:hypothetical protein
MIFSNTTSKLGLDISLGDSPFSGVFVFHSQQTTNLGISHLPAASVAPAPISYLASSDVFRSPRPLFTFPCGLL